MNEAQEFIQEARKFFYTRKQKFRKKSRTDRHAEQIGQWAKLGDGYYGEAWEHYDYPGLALKISGPSGWGYESDWSLRNGDVKEDVWPAFAKACMLNPHMNLPRIMHFEEVAGFAWGVMPKYITCDEQRYIRIRERLQAALYGRTVAEHWMLPLIEVARNTPDIALDLHTGNVMLDPETMVPVIIDPFSSTGDGYMDLSACYFDQGMTDDTTREYTSTTEGEETC